MNKTIAIIGAGQLGSRHLQGLAKVPMALDIFIVDPSADSTALALERFVAVDTGNGSTVKALAGVADLPKHLDAVIVATAAHVRLQVLTSLVGHASVGALLLEKVLFQDLGEYAKAAEVLGPLASSTWVNCAQRMWPFFTDLRARFHNDSDLQVMITGSQWGLGCNAVHNTDIAEFLWDGAKTHEAILDQAVIDSKRAGFKEFTGALTTTVAGGGMLRQVSYASGDAPFCISVFHPTLQQTWNVSTGQLSSASAADGWATSTTSLAAPYQSQLTADIAAAMLGGQGCALPTYAQAAATHIDTLRALLDGARRQGNDFGVICPVT